MRSGILCVLRLLSLLPLDKDRGQNRPLCGRLIPPYDTFASERLPFFLLRLQLRCEIGVQGSQRRTNTIVLLMTLMCYIRLSHRGQ